MSFQHVLYLKRDSEEIKDLPDHLDGIRYYWQCGARDFADTLKRFGTTVEDCRYEFNSHQLARLLASLMTEFMQHYKVYDKAYDDFFKNVKNSEDTKADMNCVNSYAILRNMDSEMEGLSHHYYDEFEQSYRMYRIIDGLTSLTLNMKEDDILVWIAG
jgi:hypothetical protein